MVVPTVFKQRCSLSRCIRSRTVQLSLGATVCPQQRHISKICLLGLNRGQSDAICCAGFGLADPTRCIVRDRLRQPGFLGISDSNQVLGLSTSMRPSGESEPGHGHEGHSAVKNAATPESRRFANVASTGCVQESSQSLGSENGYAGSVRQ